MEKILCIGEEWRGSNASGLFFALSRLGNCIAILNELNYVNVRAQKLSVKLINRLIRPFQVLDFNENAKRISKSFRPSLVLVYKGAFLRAETIHFWKTQGIPVVNFFPDVSFLAHGRYIPECAPLYNHIFTTKTFGEADLHTNFGIDPSLVSFIPHGFDPMIHRPIHGANPSFLCDASFVGNYSPHKETYLQQLRNSVTNLELKIWGATWSQHKNNLLNSSIQSVSVEGDAYAMVLGNSKINIALLSEQVTGASRGDQITSRTFHIPGAGGFMLHQRTEEVQHYFKEGEEMVCFGSTEELAEKVNYYLKSEIERNRIRLKGHARALADHSLDQRARAVMQILKEKGIIE